MNTTTLQMLTPDQVLRGTLLEGLGKICAQRQADAMRLNREIAMLNEMLAAMQSGPVQAENVLLLLYLDCHGAQKAAEQANRLGLMLPGAKGPRQVAAPDIFAAIKSPTGNGNPWLLERARAVFRRSGGYIPELEGRAQ